jgi:hypothetical protein
MTTTSIGVQELRKRIGAKAKADPHHRFWGLYTHVWKLDVLREAYRLATNSHGAPPETARWASLDRVERQGGLRGLGPVLQLPGRLVQCGQRLSLITLRTESAGSAGWRKSPCPVRRAGAGSTGHGSG